MRAKIKIPKTNSRTTFRMSEVTQLKETIRHQQVRIDELERILRMNESEQDRAVKAAHLAIRSEFAEYLPTHIVSRTRAREYVEPRQIFMWLMRNRTSMGFKSIGKICGKDHSTVIHACRCVEDFAYFDKRYGAKLEKIKNAYDVFFSEV